jgi:hypothetical protein
MIYPANKDFPFEQLTLVPSAIVNGSFFTKYLINEKPLYIETPKCFSKNGIVKTGKRMFCDLIFIRENEQIIQWIEHLETFTQKYIYDNREKWFETPLEMTDIEDSFTQITKSYKSGKNYLIRTNIPVKPVAAAATTTCSLKIYDENENNVDPESITDKTEIKTILEIQGVKCSSKNFQVELEMKQMMVFNPNDPFEKCVFKTTTQAPAQAPTAPKQSVQQGISERPPKAEKINLYDTPPPVAVQAAAPAQSPEPTPTVVSKTENMPSALPSSSADSELCEIEFDLEELPKSETIQLKNRNDVYYEKYREAKRKAKIARDLALSSYLEAKRIKNTYMLDDIEDSDDDFYKDGEDSDDDFYKDGEDSDEGDEYELDTNPSENGAKNDKIAVQEQQNSTPTSENTNI